MFVDDYEFGTPGSPSRQAVKKFKHYSKKREVSYAGDNLAESIAVMMRTLDCRRCGSAYEQIADIEMVKADLWISAEGALYNDIVVNHNTDMIAKLAPCFPKPVSEMMSAFLESDVPYIFNPVEAPMGPRTFKSESAPLYDFVRMACVELRTNNILESKLAQLYAEEYPDVARQIQDYIAYYDVEGKDGEADKCIAALLNIISESAIRNGGQPTVQCYKLWYMMAQKSLYCGHILPYRVAGGSWVRGGKLLSDVYSLIPDDIGIAWMPSLLSAVLTDVAMGNTTQERAIQHAQNRISVSGLSVAGLNCNDIDTDVVKARWNLFDKILRARKRALLARYNETDECEYKDIGQAVFGHLKKCAVSSMYFTAEAMAERFGLEPSMAMRFDDYLFTNSGVFCNEVEKYIIPAYYMGALDDLLSDMDEEERDRLNRSVLIRDFGMEKIPQDAEMLSASAPLFAAYAYSRMVTHNLFLTYPWVPKEKYVKSLVESDSRKIMQTMDDRLAEKDAEISRLKTALENTKPAEPVKRTPDDKKLAKLKKTYENKLSRKTKELQESKDKCRDLQQYISLLEAPEDTSPVEEKADMELLMSKRFVFVCINVDAHLPDLKKMFPNSVFLESCGQGAASGVDAVILIIRHISHPLYFKALKQYKGVPVLNYNRKNYDLLYNEMTAFVKKYLPEKAGKEGE